MPKASSSQPHSIFQLWLQIGVVALILLDAPLILRKFFFRFEWQWFCFGMYWLISRIKAFRGMSHHAFQANREMLRLSSPKVRERSLRWFRDWGRSYISAFEKSERHSRRNLPTGGASHSAHA